MMQIFQVLRDRRFVAHGCCVKWSCSEQTFHSLRAFIPHCWKLIIFYLRGHYHVIMVLLKLLGKVAVTTFLILIFWREAMRKVLLLKITWWCLDSVLNNGEQDLALVICLASLCSWHIHNWGSIQMYCWKKKQQSETTCQMTDLFVSFRHVEILSLRHTLLSRCNSYCSWTRCLCTYYIFPGF